MEFEIKPKERFSLEFSELFRYYELFYFFTWRDIKVKYKETFLGFLWAILQPLLMTVLFTLGFGRFVSESHGGHIPYPLFALSGLIIWSIFSGGVNNAGNSMLVNANIIKKIYFPRLIIPFSSVLVALFDFSMSFVIFIVALFYYGVSVHLFHFMVYTLSAVLLAGLASLGTGTFLAALNVKYRDFRYVIPFLIQALLFASPVIYSFSSISNIYAKYILALNPMYIAIELFRYGIDSELNIAWPFMLTSLCSVFFFLILGLIYFRRTEAYFADLA